MTERLYYTDPALLEFTARVTGVRMQGDRTAILLDRSAFYPTSGGQLFDTGALETSGGNSIAVTEVVEDPDGDVLHLVGAAIEAGSEVRGRIDAERRRDHTQQHTGQHLLSAAFERLFDLKTVSFHMGAESCTIDLETSTLSSDQIRAAEAETNRVVLEDRHVGIRFASRGEAEQLGVRKIPPDVRDTLRLIDIRDYDLNACGGTHVASTGQVGAVLIRKTEKVRQGMRVEFVCGNRAVQTARRDYETLLEAGGMLSAHIWDLPQQIAKLLEELKQNVKVARRLHEELAEFHAARLVTEVPADQRGFRTIALVLPDRDIAYIKLLAQKLTATCQCVALLGVGAGQPGVVFAQTPGGPGDMGALMKDALAELGGRGGGNRDMAQGGTADAAKLQPVIDRIALSIRQSS